MDKWFPIETGRLLLREFATDDEADVHEYAGDPMVTQYMDWGPNTPEQTREAIGRRLREQQTWPRNDVTLAVELQSKRKVVGAIRFSISQRQTGVADLGFVFTRRYWNRGYATEATAAILTCAFSTLRLRRVWATCDVRNVGSWRVMEKAGMRRESIFPRNVFQKGEWRDSFLYGRLEEEAS